MDEILAALKHDESSMVLVLLDYSINHEILYSVFIIGFSNNTIQFFRSYLNERKQRVRIDKVVSSDLVFERGVPQGTILEPLLYPMYTSQMYKNPFFTNSYPLFRFLLVKNLTSCV